MLACSARCFQSPVESGDIGQAFLDSQSYSRSKPWVVAQFLALLVGQSAKALTTKVTKVHEGKRLKLRPSWYFVSLVVNSFAGCPVKLTHYLGLCNLAHSVKRARPFIKDTIPNKFLDPAPFTR